MLRISNKFVVQAKKWIPACAGMLKRAITHTETFLAQRSGDQKSAGCQIFSMKWNGDQKMKFDKVNLMFLGSKDLFLPQVRFIHKEGH
ncbi:MAG: hypothetical protein AB7S48_11355 [Bacteroidales bacterium]